MLRGNTPASVFGIYVYIVEKYNRSVFYIIYVVQLERLLYFMYLFTKHVHVGFVFSGHNQKKDVFNTAGDEKGKLDKTEMFSYKSVTSLPT